MKKILGPLLLLLMSSVIVSAQNTQVESSPAACLDGIKKAFIEQDTVAFREWVDVASAAEHIASALLGAVAKKWNLSPEDITFGPDDAVEGSPAPLPFFTTWVENNLISFVQNGIYEKESELAVLNEAGQKSMTYKLSLNLGTREAMEMACLEILSIKETDRTALAGILYGDSTAADTVNVQLKKVGESWVVDRFGLFDIALKRQFETFTIY